MADISIKDVTPSSANLDDKIPVSQTANPSAPTVVTPAGIIALHSGTNTHAQIDTALTRLVNTSGNNTGDNASNSSSDPTGSAATVQGN